MNAPARILVVSGGALAAAYALGVGFFALLQRRLIYQPSVRTEDELRSEAAAARLLPWETPDGRLIGWRGPRRAGSAGRILVLSGNAGMAVGRTQFVEGFGAERNGGWEVFLLEYPGYGFRSGSPSESTLLAAATEAMSILQQEAPGPVFVLGESLGTGVAAQLAAVRPDHVAGLILITPFSSLTDVAAAQYPWLPVRLILRDRYDSEAALAAYHGPLAMVLAGRDEVVPARLGRRLFDGYRGRKRLWQQEEAGHNSLDYRPEAAWWSELSRFLQEDAAAF